MFFGKIVKSAAAITLLSLSAQAQMMANTQWGSGQWGGTQQCPYQTSVGSGAVSMNDDLKEIQDRIREAQKQLKQKKSEQDKLKKQARRAEKDITDSLESDHADFVIEHMSNNVPCEEYDLPTASAEEPPAAGQEGGRPVKGAADHKKMSVSPFTKTEWASYCKPGNVAASLCDNVSFRNEGTRSLADQCKRGLSAYKKSYAQSQKLQSEIERLKDDVEKTKQELSDARQEAADERSQGGGSSSNTESAYCPECANRGNGNGNSPQRQTDWSSVAANGITAVAATVLGYSANKSQQESNASLGYPTNNQYPAWGFGLPYAQAAVYGALSGGTGQGSFGCGGSNNNMSAGGAFGYPSNMMGSMNTMGGGMFLNGGMGNNMMGTMGYGNTMGNMGNMMGGMMSMGGMMNTGGMTGSMMGNSMMGYGSMMNSGSMVNSMMGSMMGTGSLMSLGGLSSYGSLMGSMTGTTMGQMYSPYQSSSTQYQQLSSLQQEMSSLAMRMQLIQSGAYTGYGTGTNNYLGYSGGNNYGSGLTNSSSNIIGISAGGTITQGR